MISAFSEQLLTIDELRARMPDLRARETGLKDQIAALDAQAADHDAYLRLADDLEGFLARLRANSATATTEDRQRVLRALVQDILIGPDKITIRHRIPARQPSARGTGGHNSTDTEGDMRNSSLLRWGRGITRPQQYLPGPDGQVRRDGPHPGTHPGKRQESQPCPEEDGQRDDRRPQARGPRCGTKRARPGAGHADPGSP